MQRTPVTTAGPPIPFPFGVDFQARLIKTMLLDSGVAEAVLQYIRPEYFESPPLRWMVQQCVEYRKRYDTVPSFTVMMEKTRELDLSIRPMYSQAVHHLSVLEMSEENFIKDAVLDWVKRNLFVEAHQRTKDLFNAGKVTEAYDEMRRAMDRIEQTHWTPPDRGYFFEEFSKREARRADAASLGGRISTGITQIDHMLGGGAEKGFMGLWIAYSKGGKALQSDEPVLTPTGWVAISELKVGDWVIGGSTGRRCRVQGVFPQGTMECYRVRFSDGAEVVASWNHIWRFADPQMGQWPDKKWRVGTTLDLLSGDLAWRGRPWIPTVPPVVFTEEESTPLPPYLIGLLLGGSSFCSAPITFSKLEPDLQKALGGLVPEGDSVRMVEEGRYVSIVGNSASPNRSRTADVLADLGLMGLRPSEKFVPSCYMRASITERWELLTGLCDAAGHMAQHGRAVELLLPSYQLASDVQWLVRSLGGWCALREKLVGGATYGYVKLLFLDGPLPVRSERNLVDIRVFSRAVHRRVVAVEPVGGADCTCITVDDPESLFVTRDFIVTHNSVMLQNHGVAAARGFKKTLHFILEGKRHMIEDRYDACFADELYSELKMGNLADAKYNQLWQEYQFMKRLLITRGLLENWENTILNIDAELQDLRKREGWVPDQVIIDYGDLLSGRHGPYSVGWESDRDAYRDMKTLANRGYVVWTASQVQRPKIVEHLNTVHVLTSKDIAGGVDKVRVVDFAGSLNSTKAERQQGIMRIFPELIRDSAGSAEPIVIGADFARMRFGVQNESVLGYKPDVIKRAVAGKK